MVNKNEQKYTQNSYFEFACATLFFLMGLFIANTYCTVSFDFYPCSLACVLASLIMGYYAMNDSSNKNIIK